MEKIINFLSGHGNHSLKPEEGEKEQREPSDASLLLPASAPRHPRDPHTQGSAQVCIRGCSCL